MSRVFVSAAERGCRSFEVLGLWRVATALGLSLSELVDIDGPLPYGVGTPKMPAEPEPDRHRR